MRTIRCLLIPLAVGAVVTLTVSPSRGSSVERDGVPAFGNVFVIVGENTSAEQITPAHAPYLTGTLKPHSAFLTNYHSYKKSSSLGQYIAMISGQFTKCEANNDVPDHCHQRVDNLFSQLDRAGRTWREWSESMANACDIVDHGAAWAKNIFSAHHNPALYFTRIHGSGYDEAITPERACRARPRDGHRPSPTTRARSTRRSPHRRRAGTSTYIVPNDCENGHDPCGTKDPVRQFDDFLAREVPKIETSPAFGRDGP